MSANAQSSDPGQGFGRERRLTSAGQFRRVFVEPRRVVLGGFVVLYRSNGLDRPRLGLAISKKCARRAIDRNRLKRLARESFRRAYRRLPGVDIVVMCTPRATAESNQRLFDALEQVWIHLESSSCVES
ncbi:ribonuclease P protein component [Thermochromatium tepidum]|uniref:Ribonuclease P protein component n=1 Tax=Thermochromatium tepidum ATCC 43061 TaxID=316276 RepID=A0A6I6E506_THETI|nr:ribonuclease P protein component [Thermochromatium tepidum]QGU34055.1 ribonuclease P protein component [Thermochromatium tepidum ATCC 43061]